MSRLQRLKRQVKFDKTKVNVSDQIETKESLVNYKPWFNGMKQFSSVKVNPAPLEDSSTLKVNVTDGVTADGGLV